MLEREMDQEHQDELKQVRKEAEYSVEERIRPLVEENRRMVRENEDLRNEIFSLRSLNESKEQSIVELEKNLELREKEQPKDKLLE